MVVVETRLVHDANKGAAHVVEQAHHQLDRPEHAEKDLDTLLKRVIQDDALDLRKALADPRRLLLEPDAKARQHDQWLEDKLEVGLVLADHADA